MTHTPTVTPEDIVKGATSVARDVAEGRLTPADLEAQLQTELRALVGTVAGEGDPLFALQCDIARGVLAIGGLPIDEQAEWLAVARHRAGEPDTPPEAVAVSSGAHSPDSGDAQAEAPTEPEPVAPPALAVVPDPKPVATGATSVAGQAETDGYDPLAGWQPGKRRR